MAVTFIMPQWNTRHCVLFTGPSPMVEKKEELQLDKRQWPDLKHLAILHLSLWECTYLLFAKGKQR